MPALFIVGEKDYTLPLTKVSNDSNVTVNTQIEVLPLNDGKNFVVTSGLKPGDRVVIEGVGTSVRTGMTVNPAPAQEQAQQQPAEQQ